MAKDSRFYLAMFLSLLAHGVMFIGWQYWSSKPVVVTQQMNSMEISLGLQAAMAGAASSQFNKVNVQAQVAHTPPQSLTANEPVEPPQQPTTVDDPTPNVEPQQAKVEPQSIPALTKQKTSDKPSEKEQALTAAKAPPSSQPVESEPDVTDVVKPSEPLVKAPSPDPQPAPTPEIAAQVSTAASTGQEGVQGAHDSDNRTDDNGQSHQQGGNLEQQFDVLIREHLLAKKRNPKVLRSQRLRGDVTVDFVLDRDGNLLKYQISQPSRIREFDRAAIKLVKQAQPYPEAPDNIQWQQRMYSIVIHYEVK